jgi:hypothetical protein
MTHKTYSEKLKDPRWQKKRLAILNRDSWKCHYCGDEETTLHVHHLKYAKEPWDAPLENLQTVCEHCHGLIEWLKIESPWMAEYITNIHKEVYAGGFGQLIQFVLDLDGDIKLFDMEIYNGVKEYRPQNNISRCLYPAIIKIIQNQKAGQNG